MGADNGGVGSSRAAARPVMTQAARLAWPSEAPPPRWGPWPTAPEAMQEILRMARHFCAADDITQVVRSSAETACRVLGYASCAAALRAEDGTFRYEVWSGAPPEEERKLRSRSLSGGGFAALMEAAVAIDDVRWVPPDHPVRDLAEVRDATQATGVSVEGRSWQRGSLLIVPMTDDRGTVVGFLNPDDPLSGDLPGTSEALLLGSLAQLTEIGIETVSAREVARRAVAVAETQRRQLEDLLTASVAVRGRGALDEVLSEIVTAMTSAAGFRRAAVYLLDQEAATVRARATVGLSEAEDSRLRETSVPLAEFSEMMRPEMRKSRSFLFDHRFHEVTAQLNEKLSTPEPDPDWEPGMWHALDSLTVPLVSRDAELLGLISVDEPVSRRLPGTEEIRALEMFADQCSVAVTEARRYERAVADACTDLLTGLPNRRGLFAQAGRLLADAEARRSPCAVAVVDIDHFKAVNDRHGHAAGDEVLVAVARLLLERLRTGDVVARYGGEEFVALLPDTMVEDAAAVVDDIRRRVAGRGVAALPGERVRLSAGVAQAWPGERLEDVFARADAALYQAKQGGRDQVRVSA
jgi:diguanylate cyclase (GGDEF)-like protein